MNPSDATVFEITGLSYHYGKVPALNDLSLKIEHGERIALLGANGSGKSTLLHILDALAFGEKGEVKFRGAALTPQGMDDESFAYDFRRRVGMVFQNPDVQLFNPTVFDEVAFGPLQMGWTHDKVNEAATRALEGMEIAHLRDRAPHHLSGGEKKRVAIASVLVLDPEVVLLDEPTVTLDPKSQSQVIDLLVGWKSGAKTVITATHQLELVDAIADKCFIMQKGQIVATGTPAEILSDGDLLLRTNLVHSHRHTHDGVTHSHPHIHGTGGHSHTH